MRIVLPLAIAVLLAGCVRSAILPLAADTIQITASAAPVCGATGAQNAALRLAAVETVNRGFDRFVIIGQDAQNNVRVIGTTPVEARTSTQAYGTIRGNKVDLYGTSTTTYGGGYPIVAGSHDQALVVKMFHDSDPDGQNAISARTTLGPEWQKLVTEKTNTCAG